MPSCTGKKTPRSMSSAGDNDINLLLTESEVTGSSLTLTDKLESDASTSEASQTVAAPPAGASPVTESSLSVTDDGEEDTTSSQSCSLASGQQASSLVTGSSLSVTDEEATQESNDSSSSEGEASDTSMMSAATSTSSMEIEDAKIKTRINRADVKKLKQLWRSCVVSRPDYDLIINTQVINRRMVKTYLPKSFSKGYRKALIAKASTKLITRGKLILTKP
jgi:hypothetical protein